VPRWLKLPALSQGGFTVHKHVDHINPTSWRSNVKVSQVVLQTCWKLGCLWIEEDFPFLAGILCTTTMHSFNMFSPLGKDLVKGPRDADDYDDTLEGIELDTYPAAGPSPVPDVEDAIAEEIPHRRYNPCFELDGKEVYKAQYLNHACAQYKKTGSTDQLKCVVNIQHYSIKSPDLHTGILEHDPTSGDNQVEMDLPVASLVRCDGRVFMCIGEVNDITFDNQHTDHIAVKYLTEQSVFMSFQP